MGNLFPKYSEKMKLALGLVIASLVNGQDYDYSERAKKPSKKCKSLEAPTSCAECLAMKKCVKPLGHTDLCAGFGFDGKCPLNCPAIAVITCENCVTLGRDCVKENGMVEECKALEYDSKKNACPEVCSTPASCEDCETLGKDRVLQEGHSAACKGFEWNPKKGCPQVCAAAEPTTCADCSALDDFCLKTFKKQCKGLGFSPKKGCPDVVECPAIFPTTCADCETLGKQCISEGGHKDTCKDLGFGKKGCPATCPLLVPTTCEDCETLGAECINQGKHGNTCKKLKWNKKKGCPE